MFDIKPSDILKWAIGTKEGKEWYRREIDQFCKAIAKDMEKQLFGKEDRIMFIVDKDGNNVSDRFGKLARWECFNMGIDPDLFPFFLKEGQWHRVIVTKKEEEKMITYLDEIEKKLYERALEEVGQCCYDETEKILSCLHIIKSLKEDK